jgi:hypothetical protein
LVIKFACQSASSLPLDPMIIFFDILQNYTKISMFHIFSGAAIQYGAKAAEFIASIYKMK